MKEEAPRFLQTPRKRAFGLQVMGLQIVGVRSESVSVDVQDSPRDVVSAQRTFPVTVVSIY